MPFPIVHLSIAKHMLGVTSHIKKPGQFVLGSIAPDSVHFRPDFESDMKKVSHLAVGGERWGWVTDNSGWKENVLRFYELMKDSEDTDFILVNAGVFLTPERRSGFDPPSLRPSDLKRLPRALFLSACSSHLGC